MRTKTNFQKRKDNWRIDVIKKLRCGFEREGAFDSFLLNHLHWEWRWNDPYFMIHQSHHKQHGKSHRKRIVQRDRTANALTDTHTTSSVCMMMLSMRFDIDFWTENKGTKLIETERKGDETARKEWNGSNVALLRWIVCFGRARAPCLSHYPVKERTITDRNGSENGPNEWNEWN